MNDIVGFNSLPPVRSLAEMVQECRDLGITHLELPDGTKLTLAPIAPPQEAQVDLTDRQIDSLMEEPTPEEILYWSCQDDISPEDLERATRQI